VPPPPAPPPPPPTPLSTPRCVDNVSYYRSDTNKCTACPTDCGVGTYRAGCGHGSPGKCMPCSTPTLNAHHITGGAHGAADSCAMKCDTGYVMQNGLCLIPSIDGLTTAPTTAPTAAPTKKVTSGESSEVCAAAGCPDRYGFKAGCAFHGDCMPEINVGTPNDMNAEICAAHLGVWCGPVSNPPPQQITMAMGEEGSNPPPHPITMAMGEEGSNPPPQQITMAMGEEGSNPPLHQMGGDLGMLSAPKI